MQGYFCERYIENKNLSNQLELHPKNPFVKNYTRQYKLNEGDTEEAHRQIVNLRKQVLVEKKQLIVVLIAHCS